MRMRILWSVLAIVLLQCAAGSAQGDLDGSLDVFCPAGYSAWITTSCGALVEEVLSEYGLGGRVYEIAEPTSLQLMLGSCDGDLFLVPVTWICEGLVDLSTLAVYSEESVAPWCSPSFDGKVLPLGASRGELVVPSSSPYAEAAMRLAFLLHSAGQCEPFIGTEETESQWLVGGAIPSDEADLLEYGNGLIYVDAWMWPEIDAGEQALSSMQSTIAYATRYAFETEESASYAFETLKSEGEDLWQLEEDYGVSISVPECTLLQCESSDGDVYALLLGRFLAICGCYRFSNDAPGFEDGRELTRSNVEQLALSFHVSHTTMVGDAPTQDSEAIAMRTRGEIVAANAEAEPSEDLGAEVPSMRMPGGTYGSPVAAKSASSDYIASTTLSISQGGKKNGEISVQLEIKRVPVGQEFDYSAVATVTKIMLIDDRDGFGRGRADVMLLLVLDAYSGAKHIGRMVYPPQGQSFVELAYVGSGDTVVLTNCKLDLAPTLRGPSDVKWKISCLAVDNDGGDLLEYLGTFFKLALLITPFVEPKAEPILTLGNHLVGELAGERCNATSSASAGTQTDPLGFDALLEKSKGNLEELGRCTGADVTLTEKSN